MQNRYQSNKITPKKEKKEEFVIDGRTYLLDITNVPSLLKKYSDRIKALAAADPYANYNVLKDDTTKYQVLLDIQQDLRDHFGPLKNRVSEKYEQLKQQHGEAFNDELEKNKLDPTVIHRDDNAVYKNINYYSLSRELLDWEKTLAALKVKLEDQALFSCKNASSVPNHSIIPGYSQQLYIAKRQSTFFSNPLPKIGSGVLMMAPQLLTEPSLHPDNGNNNHGHAQIEVDSSLLFLLAISTGLIAFTLLYMIYKSCQSQDNKSANELQYGKANFNDVSGSDTHSDERALQYYSRRV